jgi:ribose-phosphate pyrophosphokinase
MSDALKPILIWTNRYKYLADGIRAAAPERFEEANWFEFSQFADGELYHRWIKQIEGRKIVIVGGTIDDAEFVEASDLVSMSERYGADSVLLLIPFFGYQTMERAVKYGEDVKAKNRARTLSYAGGPRMKYSVALLDLHAEGICDYFENGVRAVHLYSKPLVKKVVRQLKKTDRLMLGATDAGRAKWVKSLARDLRVGVGFVLKNRSGKDQTETLAINGRVRGKNVFIFDDMFRTGGTLINAAKAYRARGANKIWAMCTHGIGPGESLAKLKAATDKSGRPLFEWLFLSDSHPNANEMAASEPTFVRLLSCSEILADYLIRGTAFPEEETLDAS